MPSKEQFLTVRWNNRISAGLGLIVLFYIVATLATATWSGSGAFIGLVTIGVLF